ncbi:MAG: VWA domain-containing protein [Thermoanaerobaculia bacterium]|nr:VWA domain-containing protein [Thermoanaerobaculia bacterium]
MTEWTIPPNSFLPAGLSFKDPEWFWLLAVIPLAILFKVLRERAAEGALTVPTLGFVLSVRPTWRVKLRHLPFAMGLIGFAGIVLALARPRLGLERTESWSEGVDIIVALDSSGSMAAEDFKPKNRFFVAKESARDFILARKNDRIGLITFGGRSRTVAPLTTDREMVLKQLEGLKMGEQGDGTAIGMALGNALARLKPSKAKSKVVVLVTDGGNNAGEIDPDTAAGIAKALGIRVYTVGVGTDQGEVDIPVSVKDPVTGRTTEQRVRARVDVDEKLLGRIAEATSARFFRATDPDGLRETFASIDKLEKTEIKTATYTRWRELFSAPLLPSLAVLALSGLFSAFLFPVVPR